jgi:CRISPR-associated protein Csb2
LRPQRRRKPARAPRATSAALLLLGKPLPRIEQGLGIGDLLRLALISRAGRHLGADRVPATFSGHGLPAGHRHEHASFLPWDSDGDGYLDRVLIHIPAGFGPEERRVIEELRKIFSGGDGEWRLLPEAIGGLEVASNLTHQAKQWLSVTPYLHPWHRKKRFGPEEQLRRECRERGLPEPIDIERLESIAVGHQSRRPIHFTRFRRGQGLTQPDRHGGFWQLEFDQPINGPLALGFACHYGLGLFRPI